MTRRERQRCKENKKEGRKKERKESTHTQRDREERTVPHSNGMIQESGTSRRTDVLRCVSDGGTRIVYSIALLILAKLCRTLADLHFSGFLSLGCGGCEVSPLDQLKGDIQDGTEQRRAQKRDTFDEMDEDLEYTFGISFVHGCP
eukprot:1302124-Amorphochlora_amoeboformis.AAC.1